MDEKDILILAAISKHKTGSPEKIATETGIPKSTVHYRIENLHSDGVIRNDLFDIDLTAVGINITIISEIIAEYEEGYHDSVGEKLSAIDGVNQVHFTMGDTDFIVISNLTNREMIEELIEVFETIDEIKRTRSRTVIKTLKDESHPLNDFDIDRLTASLSSEVP